jgi:hypothetical protein
MKRALSQKGFELAKRFTLYCHRLCHTPFIGQPECG